MSTSDSGTKLAKIEPKGAWQDPAGLDEYITTLCLDRTIGEIWKTREHSRNARAFFGTSLIANAVFDMDIGLIEQIANRIDGTVPEKGERDKFANLIGNAIDDVLDMEKAEQLAVQPDDTTIIAIAKAVIYIATAPVGNNPSKRKERQKAVDLILNRTGGKRIEPVKDAMRLEYVEPDWMNALPS